MLTICPYCDTEHDDRFPGQICDKLIGYCDNCAKRWIAKSEDESICPFCNGSAEIETYYCLGIVSAINAN